MYIGLKSDSMGEIEISKSLDRIAEQMEIQNQLKALDMIYRYYYEAGGNFYNSPVWKKKFEEDLKEIVDRL